MAQLRQVQEVLQAASTKWNFLNFKPGLVGGHCIGIDPYYLAYKAKEIGYNPEVILSGRKTNESVPEFIFQTIIGKLKEKEIKAKNVLILGATFKENCPDIRNSKSEDLYNIFNTNQFSCKIHDPVADQDEMKNLYNKDFIENLDTNFEIIVIAVGHNQFFDLKFENIGTKDCIIFDVKSVYPISKGYLRL